MIIVRRILATFFIFLFIPLFIVAIVLVQVDSTLLTPAFYVDQLRKADVFNFLYDEALPVALDEAQKNSEDLPVDLAGLEGDITASLKRVFPPDWLEEQAASAILAVVSYAVGDTDELIVPVPLAEPLRALGGEAKRIAADPDKYDLLFDDVIAPELEDSVRDVGDLPLGVTIQSQELLDAIKRVVPQDWIEGIVVHVVDQVVPYVTGESEHFAIVLRVDDRLEALAPEVKLLLVKAGAYNALESEEFLDTVGDQLVEFGELPFGLTLTADQLASAAQEVAPAEWLQAQVEMVLDALVPYLTGEQDGFVVVFDLKDRIMVAVPVVKKLLRDANAYDAMFNQIVSTFVGDNLSSEIELPLGIVLSADAVEESLRQALPPGFIQEQAESMIDALVPYLTGEQQGFTVVVPLDGPKEAALKMVEEKARELARQQFESLPKCTFDNALELLKQGAGGSIPTCRPAGFTLDEMKTSLGIVIPGVTEDDIAELVGVDKTLLTQGVTFEWLMDSVGDDLISQLRSSVSDALPSEYVFTDVDLRRILSDEHEERLDSVLDWTRNGFKYTDQDLRDDLAGESGDASRVETLDMVLDWGRNGVTYSDADLREDIVNQTNNPEALDNFDRVLGWIRSGEFTQADLEALIVEDPESARSYEDFQDGRDTFVSIRSLRFLLYVIPALLLLGIAFLGGRTWRGRLAWAAATLVLAAGLVFVVSGPVYNTFAFDRIDESLSEAVQGATGVQLVMVEKAREVVASISDALIGGLSRRALVMLVIGGVGVGLAIFWPLIFRTGKRLPKKPTEPSEEAQA